MIRIKTELRRLAEQDVLRRYDQVRGLRLNDNYRDETYKYVLLPVYSTAYQYKNKQYHVLINGETGRVQGEYPKSVAKILLVIAGILILIGLFFMATDAFACGAKGVPVAETAQEEYIEYEPLTVDIDGIQEV